MPSLLDVGLLRPFTRRFAGGMAMIPWRGYPGGGIGLGWGKRRKISARVVGFLGLFSVFICAWPRNVLAGFASCPHPRVVLTVVVSLGCVVLPHASFIVHRAFVLSIQAFVPLEFFFALRLQLKGRLGEKEIIWIGLDWIGYVIVVVVGSYTLYHKIAS